jgi:hypothetical protein
MFNASEGSECGKPRLSRHVSCAAAASSRSLRSSPSAWREGHSKQIHSNRDRMCQRDLPSGGMLKSTDDERTRFVDSMKVECLVSIAPLSGQEGH